MENKKQNTFDVITLIIAGFALIFSGISLFVSNSANNIAKESQYLANRPRIQLSPAILPSGEYFYLEERDNKFHIKIQLVAHNSGFTPAINITYINEETQIILPDKELSFTPNPPKISPSIGPSLEYYRMFSYVLETVNYSPERKEALLDAMRTKSFTMNLIVTISCVWLRTCI